ncbi:hypothetical protein [Polyangium aurulentum]|uniref:hypothetical protein n=1 Tax=Polyangium aurulentum TaxID=2567896 RepID=UPI0010AE9252|nr:hypothetical protein [Polyangium aurulentum]UQA58017.1 hypothetical protein E8A73_043240 [Polyangium aurulentum]
MKLWWTWLGVAAAGVLAAGAGTGCGDDGGGGSGGSGGTSSSPSASSGPGSSSSGEMMGSGGGGTGGSMAGSGGAGGGMGGAGGGGAYTTCSECTDLNAGAPTKECKSARDACMADAKCAEIYQCSYFSPGCSTNQEGGCCTLKCFQDTNAPQASIDLFKAMDSCVYCQTCKALCGKDAADYCAVFQPGATCP